LREHRINILIKQAKEKNLDKSIDFYLDFFRFGIPPHGGFGIGIDRLMMLIFNKSIKESQFIFRGPNNLIP
jgi:aspartyl-tRNA synthetase